MNIERIDLNLLVYLDALLRECSVTKAAQQLGITQPAMSNGLKRLRELFDDPILVRTSDGMTATERAKDLQPQVRQILADVESAVQPQGLFDPNTSARVFRIMVSDYAESTLVPALVRRLREDAPGVVLDFMTPSDVTYKDVEQGKIDMAINRFNELPQSFHQKTIWRDGFVCLMHKDNPFAKSMSFEQYLQAEHIWVSKTGMGAGTGVNPNKEKMVRTGWIDDALANMGYKRNITIFTRHYQTPPLLIADNQLIATMPARIARMQAANSDLVVLPVPFDVQPFELKMAWSPLLHNNNAHRWMRNLINEEADRILAERG